MEEIRKIVRDVKGEAKKCFDVYFNSPPRPRYDDYSIEILDSWGPKATTISKDSHPHFFLDGNKIEDVGWTFSGIRILLNPVLPSRLDGMEMTNDFATMCSFPELLIYQSLVTQGSAE